MPRCRTILISPLVAVLAMSFALAIAQDRGPGGAGTSRPQQPAARKAAPEQVFPPEAMDELLGLWEGQSAKLQTLEVDIYRIDKDTAWGDESHFAGHAAFRSPDLAYVDYRRVKMKDVPDPKVKGKMKSVPNMKDGRYDAVSFETILCTGAEVWHYRYDVRQVIVWTLDKDARKRALNEGPLPFLFHMKAIDAKRRYIMNLRRQDEKNSLVEIQPLLREDKEVFSTAWVTLDREFLLPTRIVLISPDLSKQQYFYLSKHRANEPVNGRFFVGVKPEGKDWKLERNPGRDDAGVPKTKRARRAGEPQSAQHPASGDNTIPRQ
jgi:TIGR03009 family protein